MMNKISLLIACLFLLSCGENTNTDTDLPVIDQTLNGVIPSAGNSWSIHPSDVLQNTMNITEEGVRFWDDATVKIKTFIYIKEASTINLGIRAKVSSGESTLRARFQNEVSEVSINSSSNSDIFVGQYQIQEPGYYSLELEGLNKGGEYFADIDAILFGLIAEDQLGFIKGEDEYYWARRGPSVHLNYEIPYSEGNVEWFYSEVTVPQGNDVIGSYYMANGFGEGYFGMQVNSETERKVLFSVWSPFDTDDPSQIPEDYKVNMVEAGENVVTGSFGNEGSGAQSYMLFDWQTEVSYSFLLGIEPNAANDETLYRAYFKPTNGGEWQLMAKFLRPKTTTYLTSIYSFLENFIPSTGPIERSAHFSNHWYYMDGQWRESTSATFTADNTAILENRFDFSGGSLSNQFFLRNNGFTNNKTDIGSQLTREALGEAPTIDFSSLQ